MMGIIETFLQALSRICVTNDVMTIGLSALNSMLKGHATVGTLFKSFSVQHVLDSYHEIEIFDDMPKIISSLTPQQATEFAQEALRKLSELGII